MKKAKKLYCKKTISIVFCVLLVFLTSCSTKADPKTATYGNYKDISFYEAFKNYCEEMAKEVIELDEADADYELHIENGWGASENLNEKTLNNNERAITYTLKLTIKSADEIEKNTVKFFMILDQEDNTVRVRGAYFDEDGDYIEELSKSEAEEMISDIYYNY
ncbi:MAG: hypothetical protein IKJ91_02005 [Clostridia bacterium]|nr:hypothetical protein [Clostridia bacterium]